jgi:DNA polymerase III delta subunit
LPKIDCAIKNRKNVNKIENKLNDIMNNINDLKLFIERKKINREKIISAK